MDQDSALEVFSLLRKYRRMGEGGEIQHKFYVDRESLRELLGSRETEREVDDKIEMDIKRTHFPFEEESGKEELRECRRILLSLALILEKEGVYVQGMPDACAPLVYASRRVGVPEEEVVDLCLFLLERMVIPLTENNFSLFYQMHQKVREKREYTHWGEGVDPELEAGLDMKFIIPLFSRSLSPGDYFTLLKYLLEKGVTGSFIFLLSIRKHIGQESPVISLREKKLLARARELGRLYKEDFREFRGSKAKKLLAAGAVSFGLLAIYVAAKYRKGGS
jgi:Rab-GTPase-TBC domain